MKVGDTFEFLSSPSYSDDGFVEAPRRASRGTRTRRTLRRPRTTASLKRPPRDRGARGRWGSPSSSDDGFVEAPASAARCSLGSAPLRRPRTTASLKRLRAQAPLAILSWLSVVLGRRLR